MEYLTVLRKKKSLHFNSSLRLIENIFKVPASWGSKFQLYKLGFPKRIPIYPLKPALQKKWIKSSVPLLHQNKYPGTLAISIRKYQLLLSRLQV